MNNFSYFIAIAQPTFCSAVARNLKNKYEDLSNLSYPSMCGSLFAKNVITNQEKLEIEKLIGKKQMEKVLDIIILSLNSNDAAKYKGFLKALNESDDLLLCNKAKELSKCFIDTYS